MHGQIWPFGQTKTTTSISQSFQLRLSLGYQNLLLFSLSLSWKHTKFIVFTTLSQLGTMWLQSEIIMAIWSQNKILDLASTHWKPYLWFIQETFILFWKTDKIPWRKLVHINWMKWIEIRHEINIDCPQQSKQHLLKQKLRTQLIMKSAKS